MSLFYIIENLPASLIAVAKTRLNQDTLLETEATAKKLNISEDLLIRIFLAGELKHRYEVDKNFKKRVDDAADHIRSVKDVVDAEKVAIVDLVMRNKTVQ